MGRHPRGFLVVLRDLLRLYTLTSGPAPPNAKGDGVKRRRPAPSFGAGFCSPFFADSSSLRYSLLATASNSAGGEPNGDQDLESRGVGDWNGSWWDHDGCSRLPDLRSSHGGRHWAYPPSLMVGGVGHRLEGRAPRAFFLDVETTPTVASNNAVTIRGSSASLTVHILIAPQKRETRWRQLDLEPDSYTRVSRCL